MNRERLELLIDVMSKVPKERLNMESWAWADARRPSDCGTVCCALGWAALDPRCNKEGLVLLSEDNNGYPVIIHSTAELADTFWNDPEATAIPTVFEKAIPLSGIKAASVFFGISENTAYDLFTPAGYNKRRPTLPIDVINKVEDLLQHGEPDDEEQP